MVWGHFPFNLSGRQSLWWEPTVVLSAEARTIRGQGSDGPWPGTGVGSLPNEPDGPRVCRGGGIHRQRMDLAPERDPIGEEIS
jgi:hypothetical protein